jgi:hypothetical protein
MPACSPTRRSTRCLRPPVNLSTASMRWSGSSPVTVRASSTGVVKAHPAVAEHRQLAVSLPKVPAGVVVADTVGGTVKNPRKVRAASVRWATHDQLRESQARLVSDGSPHRRCRTPTPSGPRALTVAVDVRKSLTE